MNPGTGKSIWDEMPEDWGKSGDTQTDAQEKLPEAQIEDQKIPKEKLPGKKTADAKLVDEKIIEEKIIEEKSLLMQAEISENARKAKREQRKKEEKKYVEYEKKTKESKLNDIEHVKKAYQKEKKENKHDFLILGAVFLIIIIGIIIAVTAVTRNSTQKVYDLIEQGNYSTAYREISEIYSKEKNVDAMVYKFATKCANDSEYKRAVASLEFLSPEAKDKEFFSNLVETLLQHGKANRAIEVLNYMQSQGEELEQLAGELYEKNTESF